MLDMYEFDGDIWLCHSFQGQCYNFTAFVSSIFMFWESYTSTEEIFIHDVFLYLKCSQIL